jgi:cobalt transporter subunit CbtB
MQQSSLPITHAPATHAPATHAPGIRVTAGSVAGSRSSTLGAALMAGLLGLVLIWGVGFSHIGVLHNAAHDTRHSNAFPCH